MIENIFNSFILVFLFSTIGLFTRKLIKAGDGDNLFEDMLLGVFCISFLGLIFSLFLPVNAYFGLIILVPAIFSLLFNYREYLNRIHLKHSLIFLSFVCVISLFMGYEHYPYNTDSDYYHANAVKWIAKSGSLTGLANLNIRLGFNSSWHIVAAFLDNLFFHDKTAWTMPILSYIITFGYFSFEYLQSKKLWLKVFCIIHTFWLFINIYTWGFPSLHYDFIPLVFNSVVILKVLKLELDERQFDFNDMKLIFLFSTASFLIKPMAAVSVLFTFLYILWKLFSNSRRMLIDIFTLSFIPLLALLAWLARNIIQTGWPLFPSPILGLNYEWTTDLDQTVKVYNDIKTWARMPLPNHESAANQPMSYWLPAWLKINFTSIRFILLALLPTSIGLIVLAVRHRFIDKTKSFYFMVAWLISSLMFWFLMAPDIRFGDGLFISLSCILIAYCTQNYYTNISQKQWSNFFIVFIFTMYAGCLLNLAFGKRGPVGFIRIGTHNSGPVVKRSIVDNGVEVFEAWTPVPVSSCKMHDGEKKCPNKIDEKLYELFSMCSNSPLPCMPHVDTRLRFRNRTNYKDGFVLKPKND